LGNRDSHDGPVGSDALHHQHSTERRASGILIDVHPGSGLEVVGVVTTASIFSPGGTMKLSRFRRVFDGFVDYDSVVTTSIIASNTIGER
jgi:hypothetical protein